MVQVLAAVVQVPEGDPVTVYEVTGLPPSSKGVPQDKVAEELPVTALGDLGAVGVVYGTEVMLFEAGEVPAMLVAVTLVE